MKKDEPSDDAGIMADITIQSCEKIVEKVWLKVLQEGPIDTDEMLKCTMILANCVNIVATVIDSAEDFIDDLGDPEEDEEDDIDESEE